MEQQNDVSNDLIKNDSSQQVVLI